METVFGILGLAALFVVFGLLRPGADRGCGSGCGEACGSGCEMAPAGDSTPAGRDGAGPRGSAGTGGR